MGKKRQFDVVLTRRIELTTTVTVEAVDYEVAEAIAEELIARGEAGLDKVEVVLPPGWRKDRDETEVTASGEIY